MSEVVLRGITWNHSRALPPLVATAQRYEETHPGVRIHWEKRTLHEFGHASLAELASRFDLLVIDHPMMGDAAGSLVDLGRHALPDLRNQYVGPSFASYEYEGALFALPIDAAAPAASYRPDLLALAEVDVPRTWSEVLHLARHDLVRMPGFPADLFLNWMGLAVSMGCGCADNPERLLNREQAFAALEALRELASTMPETIYDWNPIALYEAMAAADDFAYCPFAYTYSNYARRGFAANLLNFTDPVRLTAGTPIRTVLGGTGIALSKKVEVLDHALAYALFVADSAVQRDLYGLAGGQPAAKVAWDDPVLDGLCHGFYSGTRESIDSAYIRPRYSGYIPLQERGGVHVAEYLRGEVDGPAALDAIDALYRKSLPTAEGGQSRG